MASSVAAVCTGPQQHIAGRAAQHATCGAKPPPEEGLEQGRCEPSKQLAQSSGNGSALVCVCVCVPSASGDVAPCGRWAVGRNGSGEHIHWPSPICALEQ